MVHGKVLKFQKKVLKLKEICVYLKKPSRDPIGPSRDPVGHQFSSFWHHVWTCREDGQPKTCKNNQKHCKELFFMNLAASRHWCPTGCRLYADWIPTGSRLAKSGAQKCKNWCPTGSRRDPDKIPTLSIDRQEPTPAPIFPFPDPPLPLFFSAHQPCTNTPPLLHQNGKSSLKPNGGSTM